MQTLIVWGKASQKVVGQFVVTKEQESIMLMDFLLERNIPIASSCGGEGLCRKCIIQSELLSCQISVGDFLLRNEKVEVGHL